MINSFQAHLTSLLRDIDSILINLKIVIEWKLRPHQKNLMNFELITIVQVFIAIESTMS